MDNCLKICLCLILLPLSNMTYADEPSFDDIQAAINQKGICSVEGTLKWLSEAFPLYTQNFTLMRESLSLQGATPSSPRAVVFGEKASLLLTFNGEASQKGGQVLELAQLRTQPTVHWEFREIKFHNCQKAPDFSEPNPTKCARCHTSKFNPIWNDYDQWPGAYGENDDGVLDFSLKYSSLRVPSRDYDQMVNGQTPEKEVTPNDVYESDRLSAFIEKTNKTLTDFLDWKNRQPTHPRYKYLSFDPRNESKCAPYTDESPRSKPHYYRPNLRLTVALAKQQGRVIADRMRHEKKACYETLEPALIGEFMRCSSAGVESETKMHAFREMLLSHKSDFAEYFGEYGHSVKSWTRYSENPVNLELSILLRLLGVDARDWNTSFEADHWQYFIGSLYMVDEVMRPVYNVFKKKSSLDLPPYEAFLSKYYPTYYSYENTSPAKEVDYSQADYSRYPATGFPEESYERAADKACREITTRVRFPDFEAIKENCMSPAHEEWNEAREMKVQTVLGVCSECHMSGKAPNIDFDQPTEIDFWKEHILDRLKNKSLGQMPPERGLGDEEKFWLTQWLSREVD